MLCGPREGILDACGGHVLETFTPDLFVPLAGSTFTAAGPDGPIELTLGSVDSLGIRASRPDTPGLRTEPFSLVFLGPLSPWLPQQTLTLVHPVLGTVELFLVPIGPKDGRMRYEAIFN